jgi:hypothetical protein
VTEPHAANWPEGCQRHPGLHPREANNDHSKRHRHRVIAVDSMGYMIVVNIEVVRPA